MRERTLAGGGRVESESIFRDANERIAESVRSLSLDGRAPFICECRNERCTEFMPIALDEYEAARSRPERFLTVPGHELSVPARIVAETERFSLLERSDGR